MNYDERLAAARKAEEEARAAAMELVVAYQTAAWKRKRAEAAVADYQRAKAARIAIEEEEEDPL